RPPSPTRRSSDLQTGTPVPPQQHCATCPARRQAAYPIPNRASRSAVCLRKPGQRVGVRKSKGSGSVHRLSRRRTPLWPHYRATAKGHFLTEVHRLPQHHENLALQNSFLLSSLPNVLRALRDPPCRPE